MPQQRPVYDSAPLRQPVLPPEFSTWGILVDYWDLILMFEHLEDQYFCLFVPQWFQVEVQQLEILKALSYKARIEKRLVVYIILFKSKIFLMSKYQSNSFSSKLVDTWLWTLDASNCLSGQSLLGSIKTPAPVPCLDSG